ncbi:MAG: glycosyltransferase family 39 protein [Candidatus Omnitrophota bacterium]
MKRISLVLIIILAAYGIFFFRLGERSLWDPDEPRYAQAAREMLETGDFITPTFNHELRFDKPPLTYWLITLAYKIFGVSEFSARFFPALFGLGTIFLTYLIATVLADKKAGFISAAVLATSAEFAVLSRVCTPDIILCFFITLAVFLFLKKRLILSFGAMALAVLTKGPVGLVLPALIFGMFILFAKKREYAPPKDIFIGGALFLILALPWYYLVISQHGKGYVESFFVFHHLERFFSSEFHHSEPFYYYIPMFLAGFLPWSVFLPWAIKNKPKLFLILWAAVPFVLFSLSKAKIPNYILPMFPAAAIMVGDFIEKRKLEKIFKGTVIFMIITGIAVFLFIIPRFDIERSGKEVAAMAEGLSQQGERFATYKFFKPSFVFYARHKIERLETEEELFDFLSSPGGALVFFKKDDYSQIIKTDPALESLLIHEAGRYAVVSSPGAGRGTE